MIVAKFVFASFGLQEDIDVILFTCGSSLSMAVSFTCYSSLNMTCLRCYVALEKLFLPGTALRCWFHNLLDMRQLMHVANFLLSYLHQILSLLFWSIMSQIWKLESSDVPCVDILIYYLQAEHQNMLLFQHICTILIYLCPTLGTFVEWYTWSRDKWLFCFWVCNFHNRRPKSKIWRYWFLFGEFCKWLDGLYFETIMELWWKNILLFYPIFRNIFYPMHVRSIAEYLY